MICVTPFAHIRNIPLNEISKTFCSIIELAPIILFLPILTLLPTKTLLPNFTPLNSVTLGLFNDRSGVSTSARGYNFFKTRATSYRTFCTLRDYTKKTDHIIINMNENNSFSSLCGVIDNPG